MVRWADRCPEINNSHGQLPQGVRSASSIRNFNAWSGLNPRSGEHCPIHFPLTWFPPTLGGPPRPSQFFFLALAWFTSFRSPAERCFEKRTEKLNIPVSTPAGLCNKSGSRCSWCVCQWGISGTQVRHHRVFQSLYAMVRSESLRFTSSYRNKCKMP